ncbi:MAG: hypothetical protein OER78_01710 [Nitrosopumilus sp.]|nr:hypothetical protein [Nitrosopumilus sp.]MDH3854918.1 hypothetical protein [Nitrosopumilus sp.]
MELKSDKSIKEYLKTLPDETIIKYYLDVEFSPFPVLIIEEYSHRFKHKPKEEIIKKLKYQARLTRKKSQEFVKMAKKCKVLDDATRQKSEEIFKQAAKKGYKVSEDVIKKSGILGSKLKKSTKLGVKKGIKTGKRLQTTSLEHLELIEKLGGLKKKKLIKEKEFQAKKKEILSKI